MKSITNNHSLWNAANAARVFLLLAITVPAFGCGGGGKSGGTSTPLPPVQTRGQMGSASPFIGFIEFTSGGCKQNGFYMTLTFDEDEQGNLNGTYEGRKVSQSNPPPSGDDKYKGPLKGTLTGTRNGDTVNFTLSGGIQGSYTGTVEKMSTLTRMSWTFEDQPGCSASGSNLNDGKIFFIGDPVD